MTIARRHIITGGSGFTGSYLTRALGPHGEEIVLADIVEPAADLLQPGTSFLRCDVRSRDDLVRLGLRRGDFVYHLAARQFADAVPARGRDEWFAEVNAVGTRNVLDAMIDGGADRLVFFSTDMTYGKPLATPVPPDHPQRPLGPYGKSKVLAEGAIGRARKQGVQATVFRPRLIAGAGRLGILSKLFELVRRGLPVPMIGSGQNRYQMVSVQDCAAAAIRAMELGCPSDNFNLGSNAPPTIKELLSELIRHARSRSVLLPTPSTLVKATLILLDRIGLTLMYPEQFEIADLEIRLDTRATEAALGWTPTESDQTIIIAAYDRFAATR